MANLLLFSYLKEKLGPTMKVELQTMTVAECKLFLEKNYEFPSLTGVMIAVNEKYASDETMVSNEDTIAFIPPVSGG